MPGNAAILKVFVSSPSDVKNERSAVVEAIDEINNAWADFLGVRMEAIRWETHCRPGISSDSQEVINGQLPPNYDIYLGILWNRFGTPTPRFGSGTEEEFQIAYERYQKNPKDVGIMFYFKNDTAAPLENDANQVNKVNDFRKTLVGKGILYWEFGSVGEFRQLIRIHLSKELQERVPESDPNEKITMNLDELKKQSADQADAFLKLLFVHLDALGENEQSLAETAPENYPDIEDYLDAYLQTSNSLCDKLEPTLGVFARLADSTVEAWVNEFMAQIFSKTATITTFKSYIERLSELSKCFREQSVRYAHHLDIPNDIASDDREETKFIVRQISALEQRQHQLFEKFSHELTIVANVFEEAERVAVFFERRRNCARKN